eukprot:TRINITY_DN4164_c0_g1_i2.p1 TRINITY_DN4164_c0_g1~~TRINITY_DN4164_c0_g1_i2.p1  ORF type:complete len:406 (-),score=172.58 TRINITY_DN4164_c0_g1_i2:175-1392(-)
MRTFKMFAVYAIIVAFLGTAVIGAAPVLNTGAPTAIPDQFIVVFKTLSRPLLAAHVQRAQALGSKLKQFEIGKFTGYTATLNSSALAAVRQMPEVLYVEADQVVSAFQACSLQSPTPSWGLDRIAEEQLLLDGRYSYPSGAGAGVDAYIIDTGIYIEHADFGGRAVWGSNFVDSKNTDCNGHGTHVAGTVGGTSFGVAKQTKLIAVKVLDCDGSGTNAGVIEGIQYVVNEHQRKKGTSPSVANMSLGGSKSTAVNSAVAAAIKAGVTFVVAAGNSNTDACTSSPASEPLAITVGSTDTAANSSGAQTDIRSSFSNYGKCVSVFAPGSDITSAWIPPYTQNTISGTSMASPHVAGIAALILELHPAYAPADVKQTIVDTANSDMLNLACTNANCRQSPNKISYIAC